MIDIHNEIIAANDLRFRNFFLLETTYGHLVIFSFLIWISYLHTLATYWHIECIFSINVGQHQHIMMLYIPFDDAGCSYQILNALEMGKSAISSVYLGMVARLSQRLKSTFFEMFSHSAGLLRGTPWEKFSKNVDLSLWGKQWHCPIKLHFLMILEHCNMVDR